MLFCIEVDPWPMPPGMPASSALRAIDRLKAAANLKPVKKVVVLSNGDEFELWHKPLTMAQRERAQKNAKGDDSGAFALQLLIDVAQDEMGQKLFSPGDASELKHLVRDADLQKLMLAVLVNDDDDDAVDGVAAPIDMKSPTAKPSEG